MVLGFIQAHGIIDKITLYLISAQHSLKIRGRTLAQEMDQNAMQEKTSFFSIRTTFLVFLLKWLAENRKLYTCKKS